MTQKTSYHGYTIPTPFDPNDANEWGGILNDMFEQMEEDIPLQGSLTARPTAGENGRLYYDTGSDLLYRDNGSSWQKVGAQMEVREDGNLVETTPEEIDFTGGLVTTNPTSNKVQVSPTGLVSDSGDTMTGALRMDNADILEDSSGNPIWDASNSWVPLGRLEADSVTLSGGTGISGGSVTLGGSTTLSVDTAASLSWSSQQTFSSGIDMSSSTISGLAAPSNSNDATRKAYVDSVASGLALKEPVVAATDGTNVDLSSSTDPNPIDGVTLADGDRVLLKDQSTASENGIYDAVTATDPTTWTRSSDFDEDSEVVSGSFTFVEQGTANANSGFVVTTDDPIAVGTDAINWGQFSGAGQITAGGGLSKSGDTLSVDESYDFTFSSEVDFSSGLDSTGVIGATDSSTGTMELWTDSNVSRISPADGSGGTDLSSELYFRPGGPEWIFEPDLKVRSDVLDNNDNVVYDQSNNYVPATRVQDYDTKQVLSLTTTDTSTDINTTSWVDIPWDTQLITDAAYSHDATNSPATITFNDAGTYWIEVTLSYDDNGNPDVSPGIKFNYNGTRQNVQGLAGHSPSANGAAEASNTVHTILSVSSGDTLKVQTLQQGNSGTVTMRSKESQLNIHKLAGTFSSTDADTLDGLDSSAFLQQDGSVLLQGDQGVGETGTADVTYDIRFNQTNFNTLGIRGDNGEISLRDVTGGQDILRANANTNVDIPNGSLTIRGNGTVLTGSERYLYVQSSAPSSPSSGDLWVDTS